MGSGVIYTTGRDEEFVNMQIWRWGIQFQNKKKYEVM